MPISKSYEKPEDPVDVGEIYQRHGGVVYRRVCSFYPAEQAEEVCHEVWERVILTIHTWRRDASIITWLYQVTTRHCLNRVRNSKRRQELSDTFGDPSWAVATSEPNQEAWTGLRQLWRRLDPELFQIGLYHFRDGLSHSQIAKMLGVSARTIGNRLTQLREEAVQSSKGDLK